MILLRNDIRQSRMKLRYAQYSRSGKYNIIVQRSENALIISNAALRYQPTSLNTNSSEAARPAQNQGVNAGIAGLLAGNQTAGRGGFGSNMPRQTMNSQQGITRSAPVTIRTLWYISDNGNLEAMQVQTGISSGLFTELLVINDIEGRQFILRERI